MDHNNCAECANLLRVQGVVAAASLAICLYACRRVKRAQSSVHELVPAKAARRSNSVSSAALKRAGTGKNTLEDGSLVQAPKMALGKIQLPKEKSVTNKIAKARDELVLVDRLLLICERSTPVVDSSLQREIALEAQVEPFNADQCIAAISYEFATSFGSEKVQQGDVVLLMSFFERVKLFKYEDYVQLLIALGCIERTIVDSFDPKVVFAALYILVAAHKNKGARLDNQTIMAVFKENDIPVIKVTSAAVAISCTVSTSEITRDEIIAAANSIRAAIVRRSSRIRRTQNKL